MQLKMKGGGIMSLHDYKFILARYEVLLEEAEKLGSKEEVLDLIRREIKTLKKTLSYD